MFVTGFVLGAIGGLLQRLTWETAHAASAILSGLALLALLVETIWRPPTDLA